MEHLKWSQWLWRASCQGSDIIKDWFTRSREQSNIIPKPSLEALQGKRDTLECDIIIGGLISFSPIVIYVVWLDKSSSPKDYFSNANTIFGFGIILGLRQKWVIHSLIISLTIAENIWEDDVTIVIFRMNHSLITSLPFWVNRILSISQGHTDCGEPQSMHHYMTKCIVASFKILKYITLPMSRSTITERLATISGTIYVNDNIRNTYHDRGRTQCMI